MVFFDGLWGRLGGGEKGTGRPHRTVKKCTAVVMGLGGGGAAAIEDGNFHSRYSGWRKV